MSWKRAGLTVGVLLAMACAVGVGIGVVGKVLSQAFQTLCSLISLTTLTSCMFKLHVRVCLCSDIKKNHVTVPAASSQGTVIILSQRQNIFLIFLSRIDFFPQTIF